MANSRTLNDDDMVTDVIFMKQKVTRTRWALGHVWLRISLLSIWGGGGGVEGVYVATATVCAMVHPQTQELSTSPCFHFYSLN